MGALCAAMGDLGLNMAAFLILNIMWVISLGWGFNKIDCKLRKILGWHVSSFLNYRLYI